MGQFLSPLDVRYIDGRRWMVLAPFTYHLDSPDGLECVKVGVGEITDFASIPRSLKVLWPSPGGPWDKPAVVHDSLHVHPFVQNVLTGGWRRLTFEDVNLVFLEALIVTETPALTRRLMYEGVSSAIGRALWDSHRRKEAAQLDTLHAKTWWIANPWSAAVLSGAA